MKTHTITRMLFVAGILVALLGPRRGQAQALEIETNMNQSITNYGYAALATGGGARLGLPLGKRTVLLTGLDLSVTGQSNTYKKNESYSLHIPLELKVYLSEPASKKLVPSLRVGLAYSRQSNVDGEYETEFNMYGLQGLAGAGLSYFFTPNVALSSGFNILYGRSSTEDNYYGGGGGSEYWTLDLGWRMGVLFRV